jgi:hypothetical protein
MYIEAVVKLAMTYFVTRSEELLSLSCCHCLLTWVKNEELVTEIHNQRSECQILVLRGSISSALLALGIQTKYNFRSFCVCVYMIIDYWPS